MSRNEKYVNDFITNLQYEGGIALDIGANHGIYTKIMKDKFDLVFAFEPHPNNIDRIRGLGDKVCIEKCVVGTFEGKTKLYLNGNPGGHSIVEELTVHSKWGHRSDSYIEVDSVTLDSFYESIPDKNITFIKCDIEGGEKDIFFYGEKMLKENEIDIILETHQVDFEWKKLVDFFNDIGYHVYDDRNVLVDNMKYDSHYLITNKSKKGL